MVTQKLRVTEKRELLGVTPVKNPTRQGDYMSNTSRNLWLGFVVAACALPLTAKAQETDPGASSLDVVGSWHLDSWTLGDGTPRCSEEEGDVSGIIAYTSDGHMSAQVGCAEVDSSDLSSLSPQAVAEWLSRRHFSYYGRYTLDRSAKTVTHHVEGSSSVAFVGSDQVRAFGFRGT